MFDVSFGELLVIAVVALVVIGPEKLPKVARTLGLLAGRMQRYVNTVKSDIERELQNQELHKIHDEVRHAVSAVESNVANEIKQVEAPVSQTLQDVEQAAKGDLPPHQP